MLRVKGSLRNLRLLPKPTVFARLFSAKKKNEIIVSEVKNLTDVALKLYSQHDLETQIRFLHDLREEEINKKFVVDRFIKRNPVLASTWLPIWISKAVVLEEPQDHVKLFPVAAPLDNAELSTVVKLDLVRVIVKIKSDVTDYTGMSLEALRLVEALAKEMNVDRLRDTTFVLHDFADGKVLSSALYSEIIEKGGLFADAILPLLKFAGLEVPERHAEKFIDLETSRQALHNVLKEELTHFLHVMYSNRFHEVMPPPKNAETEIRALVPHSQKGYYFSREPRIVKISAPKESFDYYVEHPAEGGMIFVRTESQNSGKIRFSDSHAHTIKAPCFARRKIPGKEGIYDDLNDMLAEKTRRKDRKARKVSKAAARAAALYEEEEDEHEKEQQEAEMIHRKVVIDNLPASITPEELRHALRKCGEVERIWLYRDERTSPEEVRHMYQQQQAEKVKARGYGCNPDQDQDSAEGTDEVVDPAGEEPAIGGSHHNDDEQGPTGQEAAAHAAEQQRLPTKHKLLRGALKTDSYAFVQMADDTGFARITKDAVRLFGIQVQNKSCRVLLAQNYRSFYIDVGQNHSVGEAIHSLNELFDGHFECYSDKELERIRPMYLQMTFEQASECQRAFALLLRRMEAMQAAGIAFEKRLHNRTLDRWEHYRANLYPLWVKDSWFKEHLDRQQKQIEKRELDAARKTLVLTNSKGREESGKGHAEDGLGGEGGFDMYANEEGADLDEEQAPQLQKGKKESKEKKEKKEKKSKSSPAATSKSNAPVAEAEAGAKTVAEKVKASIARAKATVATAGSVKDTVAATKRIKMAAAKPKASTKTSKKVKKSSADEKKSAKVVK